MQPGEARTGLRRLRLQLPPDTSAPATARRALRALPLGERGDDVLLLASELVTNACLHGGEGGPIELYADCSPGGTRVEVLDHGPGLGGANEGYGLGMLARAADRWGVEENGATRVWFELQA